MLIFKFNSCLYDVFIIKVIVFLCFGCSWYRWPKFILKPLKILPSKFISLAQLFAHVCRYKEVSEEWTAPERRPFKDVVCFFIVIKKCKKHNYRCGIWLSTPSLSSSQSVMALIVYFILLGPYISKILPSTGFHSPCRPLGCHSCRFSQILCSCLTILTHKQSYIWFGFKHIIIKLFLKEMKNLCGQFMKTDLKKLATVVYSHMSQPFCSLTTLNMFYFILG